MNPSVTSPNGLAILWLMLFCLFSGQVAANATSDSDRVLQSIIYSLDYIAVDYPGAVDQGVVVSAAEYAEQLELSQHAVSLIETLAEDAIKPLLIQQGKALLLAVQTKQGAEDIVVLSHGLVATLISTYHVRAAPTVPPSLSEGQRLFDENCVACHGMSGAGDGVLAASLTPKPANFHDRSRQQYRNIYALYNTITLGAANNAMPSFLELSSSQRWALAFYVSNFYFDDATVGRGKQLWSTRKQTDSLSDLEHLTQAKPDEVITESGEDGLAVLAYLRANPQLLQQGRSTPIEKSREFLVAALTAYQLGQVKEAYKQALAAYFEGFEFIEARLKMGAPDLRLEIEREMANYRSMINAGVTISQLESELKIIQQLLDRAENHIHTSSASASVSFVSALLILLREGLEAILVLAVFVSVLVKSNRRDALRYIHAGWMSALILGLLTWYLASGVLAVSGAHRELTEGITALIAASMLLYVGFWLHNQTHALKWKQFVHGKISTSLSTGALWGLTFTAFLAVYREVFESVLFYQSLILNSQADQHRYILAGIFTAVILLVLLAFLIMRYSIRLPLRTFFRANMLLMFLLALVFAGKGVAALQEAGVFPVDPVNFPQIDLLGIHPTQEGLGLQGALILLALIWSAYEYMKEKGNNKLAK